VRVGNLQELVYKQGQAGVTKASVTIVFDNSDPAGSPVGYETHKEITVTRQVVIGGKNKYMINGHTVQQTQVQNLFHSVQLNVNNPHFLIMQGRITKVLNMKPPEILSMIEEAAGTRMFETKKQAALKTIEKKQQKVEEITRVIESDIEPKLLQLRNEQKSYQEWSSTNTELERLERLCVAAEYKQAEEKVLNSEGHQETMRADMARMQEQHDTLVAEADQCQATIDELEARRESEQSGEFQLLKKREQELSKEVVKANSSHTNQKKSLQSENELLTSLEKQVHTAESGIVEKEAELAEAEVEVGTKTEEVALAEKEAVSLRTKYQNACAGVTDEADAQLLSLPEQVGVWETRSREAQSKLQQETMRNQHSMDRLKELKKQCKGEQSAHGTELRQVDALKAVVDSMQKNLQKMTYSDEEETSLRAACRALQGEVEQMQDEFETASAKVEARLNFEFRDPERGFDRSRVKGLVAKLVRIQDKIHATALEVAAGGKLFQVVVDNEQTGKLLLGKNVLQKRVTILPLNKISSRTIDPRKLNLSREVARAHGGSAHLALELVGYSEEVTRAMQYVFGNTIICDTSAVAQAIAFDKNIQCRTITLDGDTYDPAGTATGGSKNQIGSLLSRIGELGDLQAALDSCKENLKSKQKQLAAVESTGSSFRDLSEKLEMKLHELAMAEDRLSGSSYAQIAAEVAALEKDVSHFDEDVAKPLKEVHQNAQAELKKLKDTANGIKKQREQAMKNMEAATKEAQKKLTVIKSEAASVKAHRDALAAEVEGLKTELKALNEQYLICEGALKRLSAEVDALEQEVALRRE
ncbi:smc2, partial [Symbiodinium microadriaticum]